MVIIEVGIGLSKIRIIIKTEITVKVIYYLKDRFKVIVSIGSTLIIIGSILLSTLTSVINNIIRIRIVNTIEVILNIIRIVKTTKTNRITRIIVVIRVTTRISKTVNKAAISVGDLALSLI